MADDDGPRVTLRVSITKMKVRNLPEAPPPPWLPRQLLLPSQLQHQQLHRRRHHRPKPAKNIIFAIPIISKPTKQHKIKPPPPVERKKQRHLLPHQQQHQQQNLRDNFLKTLVM